MQISIGSPVHGWMPFSILIGGRSLDFRASNVVNDPVTDLLFAAIWALDSDYELPAISDRLNPALFNENSRCAHFWLEPSWHTLTIERTESVDELDVWFAVEHAGGLFVTEDDIAETQLTLSGRISVHAFAGSIHRAIRDSVANHGVIFEEHWRRPFPYSTFITLGTWLDQIRDSENVG